ncbi:MAG: hypothetical protein FWG02_02250 [Holophagaceae bacterium]|nr:hypothetical protein [Holophagaceae bacterium]
MRYIVPCLLVAGILLPADAQTPKFIKVEIETSQTKSLLRQGKGSEIPESVLIRFPIALAKTFLKTIEGNEIKVNGEEKPGMKADEILKLLNEFKVGDLLLEITTSDGDYIKISLE